MRARAAQRLADDVRKRGNHLSTGFPSTPYLCHVLSQNGQLDLAYALLEQDTYPSWLYTVVQGATTMWERWDSIKPDGSFQDPGMNSFNHCAYGAIGDWLYRVVAGIELDADVPGYKRIHFQPRPGGSLRSARARLESQYGTVESAWRLTDARLELDVTTPPNAEGIVHLPVRTLQDVSERGGGLLAWPEFGRSR